MKKYHSICGLMGLCAMLLLGSCRSDYTQMVESEAKNPTPTEDWGWSSLLRFWTDWASIKPGQGACTSTNLPM